MKQMILAKQTIRKEMSFPMGCFARIIFASGCFLQKREISALFHKGQTKVVEDSFSRDGLLVETARLKDDSYPRDAKLPQWPSDMDAFKDKKQYYLLKKSELQEYDWIRTYTELAFLRENNNIHVKEPERSRLAILKVAVESLKPVERPKDRLKARNATFY